MVDIFKVKKRKYRQDDPDFSVLDLKAYYRGYRYVRRQYKCFRKNPNDN